LYGDKDSYRLAALALHEPSEITPIALGSVGFYDDHGLFQLGESLVLTRVSGTALCRGIWGSCNWERSEVSIGRV